MTPACKLAFEYSIKICSLASIKAERVAEAVWKLLAIEE